MFCARNLIFCLSLFWEKTTFKVLISFVEKWFLYLKTATEQVIQINDNQYIMYYYKSLTKVQTFIIKQTTIYLSAGRIDGPQLFVLNIYMKWVIIYTSLLTILNIVTHARFYDDTRKVCDISTSYNFHRFSFQNCAALYFVTITV